MPHARLLALAGLPALVVSLTGCDRPVAAATPAPAPVSTAAPAPVASDAPAIASVPSASATTSAPPLSGPSSLDPSLASPPATPPPPHQDGVPYPIPDPLPPEAIPRVVHDAPSPAPGPAPLSFWVGGTGDEDGKFIYPRALVVDRDGSVIVVDKGTARIQRFSADGRVLCVVRTPSIAQGKPTGLDIDAEGQLLVADTHYSRVLVYGPDLAFRRTYGAPGRDPGCFMLLSCVKAAPDGRHWTTDYGDDVARVQTFEPDGKELRAIGHFGLGEGELRRPMSLAFDGERGEVFVADAVNHRIVVLGLADGRWLRTLAGPGRGPGQLDFPYDIVVDEQHRLWVCEFGNQRLQVLDPQDGRCLGLWGTAGRRLGCLNRPWGVALGPNGRVWVLDSMNDRLYALDRAVVLGQGVLGQDGH
jgi:sugar lactone lactonase YvrE